MAMHLLGCMFQDWIWGFSYTLDTKFIGVGILTEQFGGGWGGRDNILNTQ